MHRTHIIQFQVSSLEPEPTLTTMLRRYEVPRGIMID